MKSTRKLFLSSMMLLVFVLTFFMMETSRSITRSTSEEWVRNWGNEYDDNSYDVIIDSKGNVYIVGQIALGTSYNSSIVKFDSNGGLLWNRTWGGNSDESLSAICVDSSDNIYVAGSTRSYNISKDALVMKYDENGTLLWNRSWGGPNEDFAKAIGINDEGKLYVAVSTTSFGPAGRNFVLLIYDLDGTLLNHTIWGGSGSDYPKFLSFDSNGDVIMGGETASFGAGSYDLGLVKFDKNGKIVWNVTWGSTSLDRPGEMVINSKDEIFIAGFTYHPDIATADSSFFITKLNASGFPVWSEIWGTWMYSDLGTSIVLDEKENILFFGSTEGYSAGIFDVYIAKFTSDGSKTWECKWDRGSYDMVHKAFLDRSTGDLYFTGDSRSFSINYDQQMMLVKNPALPADEDAQQQVPSLPGFPAEMILLSIGVSVAFSIITLSRRKKNK
ncbi:MAG: hypothetical protein ACTSVI_03450 [Promethearchaeota archaeon]